MATQDHVRELLRHFEGAAVQEKSGGLFPVSLYSTRFALPETAVDAYLDIRDSVEVDPETSMFTSGYYEHAVDILGPRDNFIRLMNQYNSHVELLSGDGQICLEMGGISLRFLLTMLDKLEPDRLAPLMARMPPESFVVRRYNGSVQPDLADLFSRVMSVKVTAPDSYKSRSQRSTLQNIAESGLFNIAYAGGFGLNLGHNWDRSNAPLGIRPDQELQFPRRLYNGDLLAYYQLALSSESAIVAYLLFFNILESFYLSTAEAELHRRLAEKLVEPNFSHKRATHLRALTAIVRKYDERTDEPTLLEDVMRQYFTPDEVAEWVEAHDDVSGGYYYAFQQRVFGRNFIVDLDDERIFGSIVKRIYHIRNMLLHNVRDDSTQFTPFSEQEDTLIKELPLLMYLAEQMIVKTGGDL